MPLEIDEDRSIVDENIDPTKRPDCLLCHTARVVFVRYVDFQRHRSTAAAFNLLNNLLAVDDVRNHHGGALLGKLAGINRADIPRSARHDRNFAAETHRSGEEYWMSGVLQWSDEGLRFRPRSEERRVG